ncbi:hypothetical protein [Hymenobacter cavernae]|uniref:hypothetical protein n=1 Tax=Hymenobacter cavernae TaxID=2044852 RepID=UPI0016681DE6|nr:hypothetical protein [Hymenobacter cavernae]
MHYWYDSIHYFPSIWLFFLTTSLLTALLLLGLCRLLRVQRTRYWFAVKVWVWLFAFLWPVACFADGLTEYPVYPPGQAPLLSLASIGLNPATWNWFFAVVIPLTLFAVFIHYSRRYYLTRKR